VVATSLFNRQKEIDFSKVLNIMIVRKVIKSVSDVEFLKLTDTRKEYFAKEYCLTPFAMITV
jgi:hypothetical protein